METYSPLFTTLYDQQGPIGDGTIDVHYSVLQAVTWHKVNSGIADRGYHHRFAIIWDEDHDTRVIVCIEEIYLAGLLPKFIMFGENQAGFTAVLNEAYVREDENDALAGKILDIAETSVSPDCWGSEIVRLDAYDTFDFREPNQSQGGHSVYLHNIDTVHRLGGWAIPETDALSKMGDLCH